LEHETIRQQMIPAMIEATPALAEEAAESTIADARKHMLESLGADYKRLEYLKQVNDNLREEELIHAREAIAELDETLAAARLRLDSIRLISAETK
jgi:hypothetical protein